MCMEIAEMASIPQLWEAAGFRLCMGLRDSVIEPLQEMRRFSIVRRPLLMKHLLLIGRLQMLKRTIHSIQGSPRAGKGSHFRFSLGARGSIST